MNEFNKYKETKGPINQEYFQTFVNPNDAVYRQLVKSGDGVERDDDNPFAPILIGDIESREADFAFLKNCLKNETLVDLGSGMGHFGQFAKESLGVAHYFGVDKFIKFRPQKIEDPVIHHVGDDMLLYCSRIPDNSVNFVINGIDNTIIKNREYADYLLQEVLRATKQDGIIFGENTFNKTLVLNRLGRLPNQLVQIISKDQVFPIFQKK